METFFATLFIVISILLILVVLLQKGRGGGLGAAFGGAGSSAFGTRTGDVFTWVTIVLTALFLLLAILTTVLHRPDLPVARIGGFDPLPGVIIPAKRTVIVTGVEPRDAVVRYTLDGSDPTEDSKKYQGGVEVQPGDTLKVRAFKAGYKPSEIRSAEYPKRTAEAPATVPAMPPTTAPVTTAPAVPVTTAPAAPTLPVPPSLPVPPVAPPATKPAKPAKPATAPAKPASKPAPAAG